ncbi:MAG TPA: sigma-70 family RNA polymerase sigma factor [Myxococcales bacterium]|nr:sigma-70 family RNA polymerase sigma factor [Myxococcales bacterium]
MVEQLVRAFPATRHSAVEALRSGTAAERERALETLASVYWRPVYGYLRLRWRKEHEEAADLTQELFAEVLEKDLIARFDPARARLRTYLRVCIDGLVANDRKAAMRRGRGGAFDFDLAREQLEQVPAAETPETLFEKEWGRAVFALALRRLQDECARNGKSDRYALLERYDLAPERPTYAALAAELGIAVTDVTNRLFRTRRELRRIVLEVLEELTGSDEELREEAHALLGEGAA